jgi:PKD repeat protein
MKTKQLFCLFAIWTALLLSGSANACTASFNASPDSAGTVYFQNTSTGAFNYAQWSFGDGSSGFGIDANHTYSANGNYVVCLTVFDSAGPCQSTICDTIVVNNASGASCSAAFSFSAVGSSGYFYPYSNSGNITSYFWSFGDGSSSALAYPVHAYNAAGLYNVCLYAVFSSGCVDTVCSTIAISNANCQASFNIYNTGGNSYVFQNTSNIDSTLTTSFSYWTFGDGTTSTMWNPSNTYNAPGYYSVCLTIIDSAAGCSNTYCDSIFVQGGSGGCNANFTPYDSSGTYYFLPDFGNAASYSWTFGDGGTSTSVYPMHQYTSPGTYTVCLTVAMNGQTCTSCQVVVIGSTPNCNANYLAIVDSTNANLLYFFNQSSGGNSYYWYFGDGSSSTSANPTHTYANSGTYLVCLTIYSNSSNCQDSYCDTVIIGNGQSGCVPQFYSYPDSTAGSGVMNFGLFNPCGGYQYVWTITNGTNSYTASGSNPIIAFADSGWHSVCVDAYDSTGAVISYCDSVWVFRIGSVGINENQNTISTNVFPNPANEQVTMNYTLTNSQNVSVVVINMSGQTIYNSEEQRGAGLQKLVLNTAEWPSGLYLINLRAAEGQNATRISVQH